MAEQRQVKVILESELVSLRYYPETKIVHHEFRKFVYGSDFRQVLEKGLEVFEQHGASKWLSDDRGNSAVLPEDGEWALNEWAPRAMKAGWKYWAVVLPRKVIGQMNMKRWISTYAERGVTAQVFADPAQALKWLEAR